MHVLNAITFAWLNEKQVCVLRLVEHVNDSRVCFFLSVCLRSLNAIRPVKCLSATRGTYVTGVVCSINHACDIMQDFPGGLKQVSVLTHCFVCSKEGMSR